MMRQRSLQASGDFLPPVRPPGRFTLPAGIALLALVLAYFQPFGVSRDYPQYDSFLTLLRESGLQLAMLSRFEPGFVYACYALTLLLTSNAAIVATLASLSVFAKLAAVRLFCAGTATAIAATLFYVFRFLPLHELTQVRASLALACLVAAFALRWSQRRTLSIALCCVSPLFHLSSSLIAPFILFTCRTRRHLAFIALLAFLFAYFALPHVIQSLSGYIATLAIYEGQEFASPNPFSAALLLDAFVILTGLFLWRKLSDSMKHVLLLEVVGIAFFYAALGHPVFAHRVREAFSVFWVFYVASSLDRALEFRVVAYLFVIASAAGHAYLYWFNPSNAYFH